MLAALGDAVWAATSGGLARYGADGSTRSFSAADGLPFNAATAIYAAPMAGSTWAATTASRAFAPRAMGWARSASIAASRALILARSSPL